MTSNQRCAHMLVEWRIEPVEKGVRGWWACSHCETVFVPMKVYEAKIERLTAECSRQFGQLFEAAAIRKENERLRAALKKAKPIVGAACAAAGADNANDVRRLREKVYAEICAALESQQSETNDSRRS